MSRKIWVTSGCQLHHRLFPSSLSLSYSVFCLTIGFLPRGRPTRRPDAPACLLPTITIEAELFQTSRPCLALRAASRGVYPRGITFPPRDVRPGSLMPNGIGDT